MTRCPAATAMSDGKIRQGRGSPRLLCGKLRSQEGQVQCQETLLWKEGRPPNGVLSTSPSALPPGRCFLLGPHTLPLGHEGVRVPTVPSGHVSSLASGQQSEDRRAGSQREGTDWTTASLQLRPRVPTGQKCPD